ncbi:ABC transporter substrate-binding protein [Oceanispirochaeta crateris]|nr:ABC transporter substrate-binding protein [Oceanispirochaeta crateris]
MKKILIVLLITMVAFSAVANGQKDAAEGPLQLKAVGVTLGDIGNPFFFQMGEGAKAAAMEIGGANVRVAVESAQYDLNKQVSQIENFIASGVQIIVLNAVDSKGIAPAVRRAVEAGVIVIAADVGAEGGVNATVTSNNYQAGVQAGEYIVKKLGGKGKVVIANGPPVTAVIDRVNGAKEVFAKNPGIEILSDNQNAGGSRDGGLNVMQDLLTAFPVIDAVFAINDPTGIGCELAIKQAKRESEMFVVGVDGSPDGEVAITQKGSIFEATPAQDPYTMAKTAVEIGWEIMQGNKPAEETILIPVELITADNVASYKGWTSK